MKATLTFLAPIALKTALILSLQTPLNSSCSVLGTSTIASSTDFSIPSNQTDRLTVVTDDHFRFCASRK